MGGAVPPICPGGDSDFYHHLYLGKFVYIPLSCGRKSIACLYTRRDLNTSNLYLTAHHIIVPRKECVELCLRSICVYGTVPGSNFRN